MNFTDIAALIGLPFAAAGAVVATLAWRTSAGTRKDQAEAEARRRHREMRPVLDVTVQKQPGAESALLRVKLVGPREMERYDRIRVDIRDDHERPWPGPGRGYTEEELRRQVWGPCWFRPGIDGGSEDHRTAVQGGLAVTDEWLFRLDPALAPRWYGGGDPQWRKDYRDALIRLRVEVGLGEQSWTEMLEVPQPKRSVYEDGGLTIV